MKIITLLTIASVSMFGQSDRAAAEYFKAQTELAASKISYNQILENIKQALQSSIDRQVKANSDLSDKLNALRLSCPDGKDIDFKELNSQNVKCIDKPKEEKK